VMPRFASGACGKNREMESLNRRRCCERSFRIAAAVNPLVIEPMLKRLDTLSGLPVRGEYAFSATTVAPLATSSTPEKPLSACARATASSLPGVCDSARAASTVRITRTALFTRAQPGAYRSWLGSGWTRRFVALAGQRDRCKDGRRDYCLDVNRACLAPNRLQLRRIGNFFRSAVHVAPTARCESHSRFVA
jgi:hypothetical protein